MKLLPKLPRYVLKNKYQAGLRTGILLGFGTAYIISKVIYGGSDIITAFAIFAVGSYLYFRDVKKGYDD